MSIKVSEIDALEWDLMNGKEYEKWNGDINGIFEIVIIIIKIIILNIEIFYNNTKI